MEKKLRDYIEEIEHRMKKEPIPGLLDYHKAITAQFQHERLVHLIVTMFFALFLIVVFVLFGVLEISLPKGGWATFITAGVGAIDGILLIVTLFYVHHYYKLENGVQRLEEITAELYKRLK